MPFTGQPFDQVKAAVARQTHPAPIADIPQQLDDDAVDVFAAAMKRKLADARTKGRGGWQNCSPDDLSRMLREHVDKGDPRDVANFCMFLWSLGYGIAPAAPMSAQPSERELHAALQRVGTALGLPAGSDITTDCVPAIEALRARGAVPSGWKLVPVEITDGMADSAADDHQLGKSAFEVSAARWKAMLAAAPKP